MSRIEDAFDKAIRLAENHEKNFIELGLLLKYIKQQEPILFNRFCQMSCLGRRKAYYLVQIAKKTEGLPISKKVLSKIGWTKMTLICGKLDPTNWEYWIALAEENSVHGLKTIFSGQRPNHKSMVLYFRADDYDYLTSLLPKYGAKFKGPGLARKEEAIIRMAKKLNAINVL